MPSKKPLLMLKYKSGRSEKATRLKNILAFPAGTNFEKMEIARRGISKDTLIGIKQAIGLDYDHLSAILGTTKTTLHKKQGNEVFSSSISEKAIALMDVYEYGYEVFEDRDKFNKWIQTNNRALGNRIPLEVMDTIFGIDEVKNVITRIDHGVYS
jgi:putative toxin-antitoxin system antitoxin component (TIGR02293 family)